MSASEWTPKRPWHWFELLRTAAALIQVLLALLILAKVY